MARKNTPSARIKLDNQIIPVEPDYPLQGTIFDIPLSTVLRMQEKDRAAYIARVLTAFSKVIKSEEMALKRRVPKVTELRDLRRLLRAPADKYLFWDEKSKKHNVLGKGTPGGSHTVWSRKFMWQMATKQGALAVQIVEKSPSLVKKLTGLLDGNNPSKQKLRIAKNTAIQNILSFLQFDKGVGSAFPPMHAKFLADHFLPKEDDCIVVDPSAGWGGRFIGSMCVKRKGSIHYIGIDPEKRNKDAYEALFRRVSVELKREISGERKKSFYYRPFEDWIKTSAAKSYLGNVDLVMTSPPYFSAENYNTENLRQSANRYKTYEDWREKFYRQLMQGAFDLLKSNGIFVLNIANTAAAKYLERDARKLSREVGFESAGFFKLAMSVTPGTRGNERHTCVVDGKTFKHEPVFCFRKPIKK